LGTEISALLIKQLRDKTGVGIMDCKKALKECDGDIEQAVDYLRKKGIAIAKKRGKRSASEGRIQSYIHTGGKIGVLVEVNCETDFSANSKEFTEFVKNLAMHIAATNPIAVSRERISSEITEREKGIYLSQARDSGKPEKIIEKIVEGKMSRFFAEASLLEQQYVKNPDITIQDVLNELIAKTGENIVINRFVRFRLGETQ
jgi:elongation factor Ts